MLTVSAPVLNGENTLEISVEDGRGGLLDPAIFVMPKSGTNLVAGTDADDTRVGNDGTDDGRGGFGDDTYTLDPGGDRLDGSNGMATSGVGALLNNVHVAYRDGTTVVSVSGTATELRNVAMLVVAGKDGTETMIDLSSGALDRNLPPLPGNDFGTVEIGGTALSKPLSLLNSDFDFGGDAHTIVRIASSTSFTPCDPKPGNQIEGTQGALFLNGADEATSTFKGAFTGTEAARACDASGTLVAPIQSRANMDFLTIHLALTASAIPPHWSTSATPASGTNGSSPTITPAL